MAARTWLWIIAGFIGTCVLGLVLLAGAGFYFVSHHFGIEKTTSPTALRQLDEARAHFKTAQPLIEIDRFEHPREARPLASLPSSPVKPQNLHVLAWDPEDARLARITLPLWVLRLGRRKMDFLDDEGFSFEQLNLDIEELERIGPALVVDYRTPMGHRVLVWTQ
jgi:hypothetical protein